jgi:hypothetical protein
MSGQEAEGALDSYFLFSSGIFMDSGGGGWTPGFTEKTLLRIISPEVLGCMLSSLVSPRRLSFKCLSLVPMFYSGIFTDFGGGGWTSGLTEETFLRIIFPEVLGYILSSLVSPRRLSFKCLSLVSRRLFLLLFATLLLLASLHIFKSVLRKILPEVISLPKPSWWAKA